MEGSDKEEVNSALMMPLEFACWSSEIPRDIRIKMSLHMLRWFWEDREKIRASYEELLTRISGEKEDRDEP